MNRNCERTREFFAQQVKQRIEDIKNDPSVAEKFDFLNLMIQSEEGLYDMYGIVSQIADIFLASTQTTTIAIQQSFNYLVKNKDALERLRGDVDRFVKQSIEKDPSLKDLSHLDVLCKIINGETCYQFDFLT